jgi:ubiquinone/menaquinone biosynthesis C-methylase UbiE
VARIAFDRTGIEAGKRVLDVGTGLGALAVRAAEHQCSVLAFDSSDLMVERANHRLAGFSDARAVKMNARTFDLDDDSFDAAYALFSVTLMPHRDTSLREMVRVVRPGGIVCLVDFATGYAGCVDISVESVEAPAQLPVPTEFFDELGAFFVRGLPGFSDLQPAQRADLQSLVAGEVARGGPWNVECTLGIGHVPRN